MSLHVDAVITPFDPNNASRAAWAAYHRFRRIRHEERDRGDPILDDHAAEALLSSPNSLADVHRFTSVAPDGEVTGWLEFEALKEGSPSHAQNPNLAFVEIEVISTNRHRGLGAALLDRAVDLARRYRRNILEFWTAEPEGRDCLKHLDGRLVSHRRENRLVLDHVDWKMVRSWAKEGPTRSPESRLRWFDDRIDDDIVASFAGMFTEVFNQQPFDAGSFHGLTFAPAEIREHEARIRDAGGSLRTAISLKPDGAISGLTEMWYFPTRPTMIVQGLTGVRDRYRGRGVGKWLKAEMLLRVRDEWPDIRIVTTGNASSNAAMLSINERLGFRMHKEAWIVELSLEAVERYLARRTASQGEVV